MSKKTKKETTKKVKSEEVKEKPNCVLEIKVNDVEYKTKAKNLNEALTNFVKSPEFPISVKTKVVINYSEGKKKGRRILPVSVARRLFSLVNLKPAAIEIFTNKLTLE